ncbi:MAG: hypothetical protein LBU95_06180 [Rikenellaceae bacterium]|jgi:hypothetical protein|nr:hypothetical protein [Rikenellaceae bacterium]
MKRSLTFFAFALCAALALSSCIKNEEISYEDQMKSSGSTLYSYGAAYHGRALGPAYIALRLNTLLYEADRLGADLNFGYATDEGEVVETKEGQVIDYRAKLFGNATFVHTNPGEAGETVTITYPNNYSSNTASDYEYNGSITFVTHGNRLGVDDDQNEVTWEVRMNSDNPLSRSGIYFKWGDGDYTISVTSITVTDFQSYYSGAENCKSSWDASYWFSPGDTYIETPSYVNYTGMAMTHGGSSEGTLIKSTPSEMELTVSYTVSSTLTTQFKCAMNAITAGTEKVSAPDFKTVNPETFPESSATMVWSWPNESACTRYGVLTYAGFSAQYTF